MCGPVNKHTYTHTQSYPGVGGWVEAGKGEALSAEAERQKPPAFPRSPFPPNSPPRPFFSSWASPKDAAREEAGNGAREAQLQVINSAEPKLLLPQTERAREEKGEGPRNAGLPLPRDSEGTGRLRYSHRAGALEGACPPPAPLSMPSLESSRLPAKKPSFVLVSLLWLLLLLPPKEKL